MNKQNRYIGIIASTCIAASLFLCIQLSTGAQSTFEHNGAPTQALKNLFNHLDHPVETLQDANDFAQKHLLRRGERWDEQNELFALLEGKKQLLIDDLDNLGMLKEIKPTKNSYDYILLMGATTETVKKRLNYLAHLKKDHAVIFKKIILLGSDRPLLEREKVGLPAHVITENQMLLHLIEHHPLLRDDEIIVIDSPMIQKPNGTLARPTTDTTIINFAQTAPHDGSCLVISNAPYIIRQTKATKRLLDQTRFTTEGAGPAKNMAKEINIAVLIDEFARTLYETYKGIQ